VLGSIYGGFATPTEAGAVGSLGALFCAAANRKLNWKVIKESVFVTTEATCMMSWIAFGSLSLAAVYGLAGGTEFIKRVMVALPLSPLALIFAMQMILFFLGMILDWLGILFLTIPLFAPVVTALGFDLVWFGVLFVINIQMAYLTPPFAQAVFYVRGVAPPEISMGDLYKSVWAFLAIIFVTLLLVLFVPQLALWLPGQMIAK
jgi:tripartite ATP-independent transporter DctM subunit